jgi:hypothetical protein
MTTISRRKLMVSGAAAAVLRPFIDAVEARADGPALKPVFFTMFKGQCQYGGASSAAASARNWVPTMEGGEIKLAPLLAPFEKVKRYMTFVVGLDIATSPQDWHWSMPTLFTGFNSKRLGARAVPTNESIDMFVARKMGPDVEPLNLNLYGKSMQTSIGSMLSWGKADNGMIYRKPPHYDPLTMFQAVFGKDTVPALGGVPSANRQAALERSRRSLLDAIRGDAAALKARAASAHRAQIDQTLDGIRQLETELIGKNGALSPEMAARCAPAGTPAAEPEEPFGSEAAFKRAFQAMVDVTLAALRCGRRRVFSFQFLDFDCQRFVPARIKPEWKSITKGVTPYHFDHTHFPFGAPYIECEQYIHGFYAKLLEGMAAIPAGSGNLLEQSLGVYATTMSHNHSSNGASYFVVGNAGGRLKSNRILTFGDPTTNRATGKPHNDLLVSLLQAFGHTEVKSFGDPALCKGGLPGFLG